MKVLVNQSSTSIVSGKKEKLPKLLTIDKEHEWALAAVLLLMDNGDNKSAWLFLILHFMLVRLIVTSCWSRVLFRWKNCSPFFGLMKKIKHNDSMLC
jgi:hypothetical protein